MKKIFIVLIPLFLCSCDFKFNKVPVNELIFNKDSNEDFEEKEPKYLDENPVILNLYIDDGNNGIIRVDNEYHKTWQLKKDIVVFNNLFCEEESPSFVYFQDLWFENAEKYEDFQKYKVGWYINFSLEDGTIIDQMIFSPKDVTEFYDYLEIYLYDSATVAKNIWYSHLLEEQMTNNTILTSMKLTAGSKYLNISSPITVQSFSYDSEDDFDENGHYRGNSQSTIKVYND